ncbi:hypothetical protein LX36DRAFT_653843 [Colletotrichum falcatum]|nr:hypothetical protein LX36DRAFT_653843 [Colletotrichum falcatum]
MASPALSSVQANAYGSGPINTHQPSSTHWQPTSQQQQEQQLLQQQQKQQQMMQQQQLEQWQQAPDPRCGTGPFPPVLVSDVAQPVNQTSPVVHDDAQKAQRFAEDYARLSALLDDCDPDAIRRAVRDKHTKCLLGSHYHTAFVMNVTMHCADDGIIQRAIRDFGTRIVQAGKHDLVGLMSQSDLDEVADKIISKASNTFLDKALVARLPTIDARRLVNALARAERLGYDANDIVKNERVIPSLPDSTPVVAAQQRGPSQLAHSPRAQTVGQVLAGLGPQPLDSIDPSTPRCPLCQRGFPGQDAYSHHVKKNLCTKPALPAGPGGEMYICPCCTQLFTTSGGLQYHVMHKVCGDYGEVTKDRFKATMPSHTSPNPPAKPPALNTAPTHVSSVNSPAPQHSSTPPVAMQTPRAAPSSTQPGGSASEPLGTPRAKDMAHLTAPQIQALKEELRLAEESFKIKINDTQRAGGDADEMQKKLTSLRNSYACKQSTIRKKYNIKLRQRRGREEMENERVRMGIPDQVSRAFGTPSKDAHADKRARINGNGDAMTTAAAPDSPREPPIKTVAVTEMGNGLNGSNATVATEDPTASAPQPARPRSSQGHPSRPSSSYEQNGYRTGVHVPSPSKKPNSASAFGDSITADKLLQQMGGVSGASADDNDSSSDDSSTDNED